GSLGHFSTSLLLRPNRLLKRNDFGDRRNLGNESPLSDLRPLPLERVVLSLRFNAFASVVVMVVTVVLVLVVVVVVECTALSSFPNTSVNAVALDTVVGSSVIAVIAIKHNDIKKEINVSFIVIKENDDYVCSTLLCIFAGKRHTK
uniref:Transmembrane protein n=1 Tax=Glossina palpalis gambiensis TaxID=67801 RepID=A0A1B0C186_9MUSC